MSKVGVVRRVRTHVALAVVVTAAASACSSGGHRSLSDLADSTTTAAPAATAVAAVVSTTDTSPSTSVAPTSTIAVNHFGTLPPGSPLPSDEECAAKVRHVPEVRPQNTTFNQTKGHGSPPNPPAPLYGRVTGNFTGTTDEILQWAACKWGIDEDIVRAQAAKESYWTQSNVGDNGESFGILQVRQPYMPWAFNNGVGDAMTSTAYNVDMSLAARRNCFEGNETWLNTVDRGRDYAAGDLWGCIGMWFSGRWYTPDSITYINAVKSYLDGKIWTTGGFINYR